MALTSRPDEQVWTWATWQDMPKFAFFNYLASMALLIVGFLNVVHFMYLFSTYTEETTFYGIQGLGNVKLLIGTISILAIVMNTVMLNVETSISREFKQYMHGRLFRSCAERVYQSTIPASFFTEAMYYSWMLGYICVSLFMLLLITIFFLYFVLIYAMKCTCTGTKGNAAEFVDLVSEASPDYDDQMTAAHFCDHSAETLTSVKMCMLVYTLAFLVQVNLMSIIVIQQYRLRHSGDLVPLIAPRNLMLEPVGHMDSDGHMDHQSVHDDINKQLDEMQAAELEETKELGLDEASAAQTNAEHAV